MRMTLGSWIATALIGLTSVGHVGALAQPAPAGPGSNAPFFTGLTDAASLTRLVNEHLASARELLGRLTAASGPRTAEPTLRTYDSIVVHIDAARGLASIEIGRAHV